VFKFRQIAIALNIKEVVVEAAIALLPPTSFPMPESQNKID
jgi:hypothetical protein